jgi:hypothetical protein
MKMKRRQSVRLRQRGGREVEAEAQGPSEGGRGRFQVHALISARVSEDSKEKKQCVQLNSHTRAHTNIHLDEHTQTFVAAFVFLPSECAIDSFSGGTTSSEEGAEAEGSEGPASGLKAGLPGGEPGLNAGLPGGSRPVGR